MEKNRRETELGTLGSETQDLPSPVLQSIKNFFLSKEGLSAKASRSFSPRSTPMDSGPSEQVKDIYWGNDTLPTQLVPMDVSHVEEHETLLRITVRGNDQGKKVFVMIQQEMMVRQGWRDPLMQWIHSGDCIKLLRGKLARVVVWLGYRFLIFEGWIDLNQPGANILISTSEQSKQIDQNFSPLILQKSPLGVMAQDGYLLDVKIIQAQNWGPQLLICGHDFPDWKEPQSPKDWMAIAAEARSLGYAVFLNGIQRSLTRNGKKWFPMAVLCAANLIDGVSLWDEGDEGVYRAWLKEGLPLGLISNCYRRDESPSNPENFLRMGKDEDPCKVLREGRSQVGRGVDFRFSLEPILQNEIPPEPKMAKTLFPGDHAKEVAPYQPTLTFECNHKSGGIKSVELWLGTKLLQVSHLISPLRTGRVQFSGELLGPGDAIMVVLETEHGERVMTSPIFFDSESSTPILIPSDFASLDKLGGSALKDYLHWKNQAQMLEKKNGP